MTTRSVGHLSILPKKAHFAVESRDMPIDRNLLPGAESASPLLNPLLQQLA